MRLAGEHILFRWRHRNHDHWQSISRPQERFAHLSEQEIEEAQVSVNNGYKKLEDAVQHYLAVAG